MSKRDLANLTPGKAKALALRQARNKGLLSKPDPVEPDEVTPPQPRDDRGRLLPGTDLHTGGNGRGPVLLHVRDLAREHTTAAVDTLATIMTAEKAPAAARIAAAIAILDRGFGRVPSDIPLTDDREIHDITSKQLFRAALEFFSDEAEKRAALAGNGAAKRDPDGSGKSAPH